VRSHGHGSISVTVSPKVHHPASGKASRVPLVGRRGVCCLLGAAPLTIIAFIMLTTPGGDDVTPILGPRADWPGGALPNAQPPLPTADGGLVAGDHQGPSPWSAEAGAPIPAPPPPSPPPIVATLSSAPSPAPVPGFEGAVFKYDVVVVAIFRGETK
jgi:hypothetical protein